MTVNNAAGNPITISPSMLKTAGKCALQVHWIYVEGLRRPPAFAMELGHGLHYPILGNSDTRDGPQMEGDQPYHDRTGEWKPLAELIDGLTDTLNLAMPNIPDTDDAVTEHGSKINAYAHFQRAGIAILGEYGRDRTRLSGRAYEVPFDIDFAGERIRGRFDIDVTDTKFTDFKSRVLGKRARKPTQEAIDDDRQFAAYAAVKAKLSGIPHQRIDATFAFYKEKDGAEMQTISSIRMGNSHEAIEEIAHRLYRAIETDTLMPVDKSTQMGWVCSARFCGFWEKVCPYGQRSQVSVAFSA